MRAQNTILTENCTVLASWRGAAPRSDSSSNTGLIPRCLLTPARNPALRPLRRLHTGYHIPPTLGRIPTM